MTHKEIWKRCNVPVAPELTSDAWKEMLVKFEELLVPDIPDNFLQHPICESVFASKGATWIPDKVSFLEEHIDKPDLERLLKDSPHGSPYISVPKYGASDSTVMAVYHVTRYMSETGKPFNRGCVVEVGGGYGNMARIFAKNSTWIIIDLPIMSYLQYFYLKSHAGFEDTVNLCTGDIMPKLDCINLIPVPLIIKTSAIKVDTFISTFGLNECGNTLGDMLRDVNWYDAPDMIVAGWGSYNTDLIKAAKSGLKEIEIPGCPASYMFL